MKRFLYILLLSIPLTMGGCSSDDEHETLEGTEWEYTKETGNYKEVHNLHFSSLLYKYTLLKYNREDEKHLFVETGKYEETGKYIFSYPDIILGENLLTEQYLTIFNNAIVFKNVTLKRK